MFERNYFPLLIVSLTQVKAEIRKKWIRYKLRTNSKKFQKIYWQTSSSHLTRKQSRCYRGENSSSLEKRDSRELYSSTSDSPMERHRFRVPCAQQVKYSCRAAGHADLGARDDVRPIIFMCKRNSFV